MTELIYLGIFVCITQSAMFSGLNLAFFSLSKLQLEVISSSKGPDAKRAETILCMRNDANFLLTTILWGNVGINVLLTLLSDSVMLGATSFIFSTFVITLFGEIAPQAYFSRNSLKMASALAPALRFYQFVLYPFARPSAWILNIWLGHEGVGYLKERELKSILRHHVDAEEADEVDQIEGIGALNFFSIDDMLVNQEGEIIDKYSIIELPTSVDLPIFPDIKATADDPFLTQLNKSGHAWSIITNKDGLPLLVMDTDGYLRSLFFNEEDTDPYDFCHRPIVIDDAEKTLGDVIALMKTNSTLENPCDPIENDIVLIWLDEKRIITGADILGRLLKGVDKE